MQKGRSFMFLFKAIQNRYRFEGYSLSMLPSYRVPIIPGDLQKFFHTFAPTKYSIFSLELKTKRMLEDTQASSSSF